MNKGLLAIANLGIYQSGKHKENTCESIYSMYPPHGVLKIIKCEAMTHLYWYWKWRK
jgi:hypothetical protein